MNGIKVERNEKIAHKKSDSYTPNHIFSDQYNFFSAFFATIQKRKEKIADWQKKRLF